MRGSPTTLVQLGTLVARHHGWPAAKAFKTWQPDDDDKALLARRAKELLDIFPDKAGACALMSAAFAAHLQRDWDAPVQVVAGSLDVAGVPMFGRDVAMDGPAIFSRDDLDWDGHVWVMVGPYVADISIFRTASSPNSPLRLANHIRSVFGPNKGFYFQRWRDTKVMGLDYVPRYVLSTEEVDRLIRGAHRMIETQRLDGKAVA